MAEFGKGRSAVEDDRRHLRIKGSRRNGKTSCHMYGSIYAGVVDFIFRTCKLSSEDCFLDIGSGIGTVVMQAAAWAGCKSLGVEVVKERHQAAFRLWSKLKQEASIPLDHEALAAVRLIEGNFVDHWDEIKDCTVIYLNNENGWFKEKHDPNKAKYCYESKLVSFLQELDRSVTLVTMERMDPCPQGWTHAEHIYSTPNGDERIATYRAGLVKLHFYKTNAGCWSCDGCSKAHAKAVIECTSCRRARTRSGGGASRNGSTI